MSTTYGLIVRGTLGSMTLIAAYYGAAFAYVVADSHFPGNVYVTYTAAIAGLFVLGALWAWGLWTICDLASTGRHLITRNAATAVQVVLSAVFPVIGLQWVFDHTSNDTLRYLAILAALYATWKVWSALREA